MSFSFLGSDLRNLRRALGDANSEAKNYAVSQGLKYVPNGFSLPPSAGTVEAGVKATVQGYSTQLGPLAQGYIPQVDAKGAINKFVSSVSGSGISIPYVPITTDDATLGAWAKGQAFAWGTPYMTSALDQAKRTFASQEPPDLGFGRPFREDDGASWAGTYLLANPGLLTHPTPEAALAMAQSFVRAQGDAIGLPPEFIAAAGLVKQWPTDIKGAETWAVTLGTAYLSQFGVPLVTSFDLNGFFQAAGNFAMSQFPGAPSFGMCESTFKALKSGSVSYAEAQGLVVGACSWIGGAIGQMFGIPAPIGAFLGKLLGDLLTGPVATALGFGPSDHELLNAAQYAARKAADAATIVCTDLARATWLQYQHYWHSVETNLTTVFRANQEWLTPSGCQQGAGVRLFPESVPGGNALGYIIDPQTGAPVTSKDSKGKEQPVSYAYPITRVCTDITGCAYNLARPQVVYRDEYSLSPDELEKDAKDCPPDKAPGLTQPAVQDGCPQIHNESGGCGAIDALAFWNARRYVTPFQVVLEMQGAQNEKADPTYTGRYAGGPYMFVRSYDQKMTQLDAYNGRYWDSWVHSDKEYLEFIGHVDIAGVAGTEVGECMTPKFATMLMQSLQQAPAASALVQRDLARTVAYVTTAYGIKKHQEELMGIQAEVSTLADQRRAARAAAAKAATMRSAIQDAKRRGLMDRDLLNYGLLAAGGGALAGWAVARRRR